LADIIEVDFQKRVKKERYTINKYRCSNCKESVIWDSRKKINPPFVRFGDDTGSGLCQECAILVKGVVDSEGW